jgi:hypothetical protein
MTDTPLGVEWDQLIDALDEYANAVFAPIWGTPAKIINAGTGNIFPSGCWWVLFLDDADAANVLGDHDLTPDGLPLGKVFVKTTLADGKKVSVTASHELAEMLVDPGMQLGAIGPDGKTWYAYEVADAVEGEEIEVGGIPMSNFVYPAWFEAFRAPRSTKFDHKGTCTRPFELRPGGYMPVFKDGVWDQIFGPREGGEQSFNPERHPRVQARPEPMRRNRILQAQTQLSELHLYHGPIDGILSPKTKEAIEAYKKEYFHNHKMTPGLAAALGDKIIFGGSGGNG